MDYPQREVYFDKYCKRCQHNELDENKDPCDECLTNSINIDTHRPINWMKKENKKCKSKSIN